MKPFTSAVLPGHGRETFAIMKRFLLLLFLSLLSPVFCLGAPVRPNFIVILADDLGFGDVACLNPGRGRIATPQMDAMAAQGMVFTDGHSTSAVCTPSRYSLLTGRYSWRSRLQSGVLSGTSPPLIASGRMTVAGVLKRGGYATACIGKWHLGMTLPKPLDSGGIAEGPVTRGFDHFFGISASADMPPYAWIENDRFTEPPTATKELHLGRRGPAAPGFTAEDVLPTLVKRSVAWIQARKDQPFFLYLALNSPHTPLNPGVEWRGRSGLGTYGDFVMQTDAAVGEVLRAVDEAGLAEKTLVLFTSDNGCAPYVGDSSGVDPMPHSNDDIRGLEQRGHFPSAGMRGYKSDLWEGGHRVPFLVRWPGVVAAGVRCGQLVSQVDVMATFAGLAGVALPGDAGEDSVDFQSLLRGGAAPVRESLVHQSIDGSLAIRAGDWKLLLCAGSGGWSKAPPVAAGEAKAMVQLYDLAKDPGERENLAGAHPEVVGRLTAALERLVAEGRSTPGPRLANDVAVRIRKGKARK